MPDSVKTSSDTPGNAEFQVHILSAERDFYEGSCVSLVLPTIDGERGIMAHHTPFVTAVVPGELRCQFADGSVMTAAVSHGILRVENNDVLILVDSAERPDEIDVARARRAAEQAREELLHKQSWQEYLQTQANLTRAMNRLKAANRNG